MDSNSQEVRPKTLVLFHCFYMDMFEEIYRYILNLEGATNYDLVISVSSVSDEMTKMIRHLFPSCKIIPVENRGQDIGATIDAIRTIDLASYDYILKVHTKKNRNPRQNWRQDLLQPILGSPEAVRLVLKTLALPQVSMVGSKLLLMNKICGNGTNIKKLTTRLSIEDWDCKRHRFFAGSMFWAKAHIFERIKAGGFTIQEFEFGYKSDLMLQHAFERVFGLLAVQDGKEIVPL
jgi:lipopolysaccharide biosynthesis protein